MIRKFIALSAFGTIAACSGGEFLFDDGTDDTDPAAATAAYTGDLNKLDYDADNDQVVINNLPFDGPDGVYDRVAARTEIDGFGVFRSQQTAETGQRTYYAVFRETDNGAAAAVGTPNYVGFGFGGGAAIRNNSVTNVPTEGEYVYTGLYGGVRTFSDRGGIELVEGDVLLEVDINDFDETGAVEGRVTNRVTYNINGVPLQPLPTIIFATTSITANTGVLEQGAASTTNSDGTARDSGTYEGLFVGPDGEEIVGTVNISGTFVSYSIIETIEVTDDSGAIAEQELQLSYETYLAIRAAGDAERLGRIEITETNEDFQVQELGAFTTAD